MTPTDRAIANVNARNRHRLVSEIVRRLNFERLAESRTRSDIYVTENGTLVKEVDI